MAISKRSPQRFFYLFVFFCTLTLSFSSGAYAQLIPGTQAQNEEQTEEEPEQKFPEDSLSRRTPRGTVNGFIKAVANQNYSRASRYLHLNNELLENGEGERIVRVLQRLLDRRGNILPSSWISDDYEGNVEDELPEGVDRIGSVTSEGETIDLYVAKTTGPEGGPIWLMDSETVEVIASITTEESLLTEQILPGFLQTNYLWGVPIGHWLVVIVLVFLAYLIAWSIIAFILFLVRRFWEQARTEPTSGILTALALPFRLIVAVLFFVSLSRSAGISIIIRQRFNEITSIVGLIALLILLWRLSDFITRFSERRMTLRGQLSGVSVVLFLRRFARIAIIIFGIIATMGAFGVDVTAGLAALGIGGLALALGAQKSVENFVGSVTLIADRPLRVGDFCKTGDTIGTVEQIGMRSTQIRTLDRTLVTIPNGELSSSKIENYAHRDKFRFAPVFGLRYETTADQMRYLLVELRAVLYAHPKVDPEPARVKFAEFASASLNVEIFAFVLAADFNEYVEIREDLLLRMMDVVEKSGTGFAFPSQTVYLARDKGLSPEKSRNAEEQAKQWRAAGEMQLPSFSPEKIESLKGSIAYPPEGSAKRTEDEKTKTEEKK